MFPAALLLALGPSVAWAWPADALWLPLQRSGLPLEDVVGDAVEPGLDLVGDAAHAVAWWSADRDMMYLRLRLAVAPAPGPALTADAWGVVWDLDGDEQVDFLLVAQGTAGDLYLYGLDDPTTGLAHGDYTPLHSYGSITTGDVRLVEVGDGSVWLDLQVALSTLRLDLGVNETDLLAWVPVTYPNFPVFSIADVGGCDGTLGTCADIQAAVSDGVIVDEDQDLLALPLEIAAWADPLDDDSDDDGVPDGDDPGPLSCDTDHDGVVDGVELAVAGPLPGTDPAGCFRLDADRSTTTSAHDVDTDDGGTPDGAEDYNQNGQIDLWETDPNDPDDDLDSDGDGIGDALEGADDPDGDGVPSFLDDDADGDGLADRWEGRLDPDGDTIPPWLDTDSDDDGLADGIDGRTDPDGDGIPAHLDVDADDDGLVDGVEGATDFDLDEIPNHLDVDADGDGRWDVDEGEADVDCDGEVDFLDPRADDGFCDSDLPIGEVDTDPFGDPLDEVKAPEPTHWTGGGCTIAPGSGWLALLIAGLLGRRRAAGLVVAGLAGAAGPASAAEFDANRMRPSTDGWRFVMTEDPLLARAMSFGASVLINHADDPLVVRSGDERIAMLGSVTTLSLLAHVTPSRFFRLGVELPLHVALRGDGWEAPQAIGDVRLSGKFRMLEDPGGAPIQMAISADLSLPSGLGSAFVGERTATGQLALSLRADAGRVLAGVVEVGLRTGTGEELGDLRLGPSIVYGAGLSVAPIEPLWFGLEVDGQAYITNSELPGMAPTELLGSVRVRAGGDMLLTLAGGGGVTPGVGAPAWRAMFGVGWMPGFSTRTIPAPVVEAPEPPPSIDGELVVRVQGPAGEFMQGAIVDVQNSEADGVTDEVGIFRSELPPGPWLVQITFPGRVEVFRELSMPSRGVVDLTVVLIDEHQEVLGTPVQ